ncbi:MAG TPA: DUF2147 domain-containing protein [Bacteroidetes bacterium]|nr:DUF2147 domain-containing protein [Bacteroidota bacterium]
MNKLTALILFFLGSSYGFAQQADDIIGKYHLPNKLDVEIFKVDGKYFGKIIALNGFENGQTNDLNNPDKEKQNDLLLGKVIIKGLVFDPEEKQWRNGSMYGPEKGMVFNLKVTDIRETEIEVVGSKFIIWRTLTWQKI